MFIHRNEDETSNDSREHEGGVLPLLPLRDIVVFPRMVVPLFVGRKRSISALEEAMKGSKRLMLSAQKHAKTNEPEESDIRPQGTIASIVQLLKLPDGTVKVLVEGKSRARIERFLPNDSFFLVQATELSPPEMDVTDSAALVRSTQEAFSEYVRLNKRVPENVLKTIRGFDDPGRLSDAVVIHLSTLKLADKQELLEMTSPRLRLERILEFINSELEILKVEKKIRSRVKQQMEQSQKEHYLNEQMQAIQKELGERDEFKNEIVELEKRAEEKSLSTAAKERVQREIRKLKMMQPMSAEATVARNYIEWILDLPWGKQREHERTARQILAAAAEQLDKEHHGLKKPKERILEFLAVSELTESLSGPILCLVGPPGVGKTSLGRSIAEATERDFVRIALGGVRDEAEIRGHRRTYIGALPGRIIQSLKKAGTDNPVFLLDEIDKLASDFRGDPASALLEVLDPEQNHTFSDHYLELEYDLSRILFVTTANDRSGIPHALRDRMEIIEIDGYTEFEKHRIAEQYLIPKQAKTNGLEEEDIVFQKSAVQRIIQRYTREAGVRSLEREIGAVYRKLARKKVEKEELHTLITPDVLDELLGPPKYPNPARTENDAIGLTNGLAVSGSGGSILECEALAIPGEGKLQITGLLEKGMQESGQAALSYIRSRQKQLGISDDFHKKLDIHVHFPEFVPKDGPSAGVTMATSIASALTQLPVRNNVAMTGEITLSGRVLPIGGLKAKLLAAHAVGVDTVLIPAENEKDLHDIPETVLQNMRVIFVEHMDQVLSEALVLSDPESLFGGRSIPAELSYGERKTEKREKTRRQ